VNVSIPSFSQLPPINTAMMNNHKQVKSEHLRKTQQDRVDEYVKVKEQDYTINRTRLEDLELKKDIEETSRLLNLKRVVEYQLYQYAKYLGNTVDVYV